MTLQERAVEAFEAAGAALGAARDGSGAALPEVATALAEHRRHLGEPMRVALVGRVSTGKSTLANALLGTHLVATGAAELTFNVNWLRYGDDEHVVVHRRGGGSERRDLDELERLTVRKEEHRELLAGIDYVEVRTALPRLQAFELVDTPGLDSHFGEHARTLAWLGLSGEDVRRSTRGHAGNADAIVLVFARGTGATDQETLEEFHQADLGSTPINTIGVLTKLEDNWQAVDDPLASGHERARRMMSEPGYQRLFHLIQPVCGLVAEAAETCTEDDLETLDVLAAVEPGVLRRRVSYGPRFASEPFEDLPVGPERRGPLYRRFGGWGIVLACALAREGAEGAELRAQLVRRSGLADLRDVLFAHFGNRALLIKLRRVIDWATALPRSHGTEATAAGRAALERAAAAFEGFASREHAFRELAVLRDHYDGRLRLSAGEAEELLRVTGEHGVWVTQRLGVEPDPDPAALLGALAGRALERQRYWRARERAPGTYAQTRGAVRTVLRSYERLYHHVEEARRHLELVQ